MLSWFSSTATSAMRRDETQNYSHTCRTWTLKNSNTAGGVHLPTKLMSAFDKNKCLTALRAYCNRYRPGSKTRSTSRLPLHFRRLQHIICTAARAGRYRRYPSRTETSTHSKLPVYCAWTPIMPQTKNLFTPPSCCTHLAWERPAAVQVITAK